MILSNSCYNAYDVKKKKRRGKKEKKRRRRRRRKKGDRYEQKFQVTLISYPGLDS
jgi:hypothetical protein